MSTNEYGTPSTMAIRPIQAVRKPQRGPSPSRHEGIGGAAGGQLARELAVLVGDQQRHDEADDDSRAGSPRRPARACGIVLKKIEAAGDITATEMTMALVRPSAPRRSVVPPPPNSPAAGITVASESPPACVEVSDMRYLRFHSLVHLHQSHSAPMECCAASAAGPVPCPAPATPKQAAQVVVEEDAVRVEPRPHAQEIVPVGIARAPASRRSACASCPSADAHRSAGRSPRSPEILFVGHALVHVDGDVGRVAPIGRAEPDVVAAHEAALDGEMHAEAVLVDTRLESRAGPRENAPPGRCTPSPGSSRRAAWRRCDGCSPPPSSARCPARRSAHGRAERAERCARASESAQKRPFSSAMLVELAAKGSSRWAGRRSRW